MPLFFIVINWERSLPWVVILLRAHGGAGGAIEGAYARKTGNADAGVGPKIRHFTEFSPEFPTKPSR